MEQRKVLLIILSVTIILAAVVGGGIWLFYPRKEAAPDEVAGTSGAMEWEPLDYLQGDGSLPGIENTETPSNTEGDFVVTYGVNDQGTTKSGPAAVVSEAPQGTPSGSTTVATTSTETSSTSGEAAGSSAGTTSVATSTRTPETKPATPPTVTTSTTPPSTSRSSTGSSAAARTSPGGGTASSGARPAQTELSDRAYWVQVISSPNRDTVQQAQKTLREHQLGSRILTKEIGGTTYFRLRLGPFAARAEAEKFLGWVSRIDGFADSMIFVDYTTAVLAARTQ